jgi:hypothetical protein
MATSVEEIRALLMKIGIPHRVDEDLTAIPCTTSKYTNSIKGDKQALIFVTIDNGGEIVRFSAPFAYKFANSGSSYNKLALMQTLLQITYSTKMLQLEYSPDEGEIRIMIDIPVMDSRLTERQLKICIDTILLSLDHFHEQIMDAMKHGLTPESDSERLAAWEEFKKERANKRRGEFGL